MKPQHPQDTEEQEMLDATAKEIDKTQAAIEETSRLMEEVDQKMAQTLEENRQIQAKIDGEIAGIVDEMDTEVVRLVKATENEE